MKSWDKIRYCRILKPFLLLADRGFGSYLLVWPRHCPGGQIVGDPISYMRVVQESCDRCRENPFPCYPGLETYRINKWLSYKVVVCRLWTDAHLTDDISIKFQVLVNMIIVIIQRRLIWSHPNYARTKTAVLSWYVQNLDVIRLTRQYREYILIKFEIQLKCHKQPRHQVNWNGSIIIVLLVYWNYQFLDQAQICFGNLRIWFRLSDQTLSKPIEWKSVCIHLHVVVPQIAVIKLMFLVLCE